MAHFIWVSDNEVLNLDQVITMQKTWQIKFEQDGRRSFYPEEDGFDDSQPMVEVEKRLVIDLQYAVAVDLEFSGRTMARRRYYDDEAEKVLSAMKHLAAAW